MMGAARLRAALAVQEVLTDEAATAALEENLRQIELAWQATRAAFAPASTQS